MPADTRTAFSFEGFEFTELDSPDFKEDSVREVIVNPILNALGYSVSGRYRIKRSKQLTHPVVQIGSRKRNITNFPDYLLPLMTNVYGYSMRRTLMKKSKLAKMSSKHSSMQYTLTFALNTTLCSMAKSSSYLRLTKDKCLSCIFTSPN